MTDAEAVGPRGRSVALIRLATGFLQGLAFYGLSEAAKHHVWPATAPPLFAVLALVAAFAPLIVIGGAGRIRIVPLAIWTLVAAAILAAFAWHDADAHIRSYPPSANSLGPELPVIVFSAVLVFVGHHLVGPADEARRPLAPYPLYFDWAWKDGVQLALSAFFLGVFWAALELGAELFRLIGLNALQQLIHKPWFGLPVSGAVFALAVQLTDVRVALIRGVRTVGLVLLSWLLPVMTLLVLAFLAALPFTGLEPLLSTGSAATTVLSASAALIILVSAAYQDGETPPPVAIRYTARAAGLALVALTLIAADALWLRVAQYGLSPARIEAIVCALVSGGFAIGYTAAALRRAPWMKPLQLTNVVMAQVVMLVIVALFTPIADPARLAVDDQVGRLTAGETAPARFDFEALRFRSGRYGAQALAKLAALNGSPRNLVIASNAAAAQKLEYPGEIKAQTAAERLTVYPKGAALPASFAGQPWTAGSPEYPACYYRNDCDAYVLDIDGSGTPDVLLGPSGGGSIEIYKAGPDGRWRRIGSLAVACADQIAALRAGKVSLAPAAGSDLVLAGRHVRLTPETPPPCPAAPPPTNAAPP